MKNFYVYLIVLDSVVCRIYKFNKKEINLIEELNHPENKLRDIEITSDKPGRYHAQNGGSHGTFAQESDPKEVLIDKFAREIAEVLHQSYTKHDFDKLVLAAAPHMNGLLTKHLSKKIQSLIIHNIKKDLIHLPETELLNYINKEMPVL